MPMRPPHLTFDSGCAQRVVTCSGRYAVGPNPGAAPLIVLEPRNPSWFYAKIDPTGLAQTRSAAYLKSKFNQLQSELTKWQHNYTATGNHDVDDRVSFVSNGNMGMFHA